MNFPADLPELFFLEESDKLKSVLRQTNLHDGSRRENSAEHSWQLGLAVLCFRNWADQPFDLDRALKMALIHDVVEIDAGDSFVYDAKAMQSKAEKEQRAADRLFGLLPKTGAELKDLWADYELQNCPESRFVGALDRFLPVYANLKNGGNSWRGHKVPLEKILERNSVIAEGSRRLWDFAKAEIERVYRANPW